MPLKPGSPRLALFPHVKLTRASAHLRGWCRPSELMLDYRSGGQESPLWGGRMFDAIIVGARCGGSPTAMLLAKRGYRVLLVDRARFPSDTLSTHWIWPPGIACLKRWGLLDRLSSTNCPLFHTMGLDLGELRFAGDLPPTEGVAEICAPRRMLLDKLLLDAAAEAGAEIREAFTVTNLTYSGDKVTGVTGHGQTGTEISEEAQIVIGTSERASPWSRNSLTFSARQSASSRSEEPEPCPISFASRTAMVGLWSAMRVFTRTRSSPKAFRTLSAVPNGWRMPSMPVF